MRRRGLKPQRLAAPPQVPEFDPHHQARSLAGALEQLLDVSDQVALEEARRLEQALSDSTDRAAALAVSAKACKEKSALLESILDSMAEGVAVANEQGELLILNRTAQSMLGGGGSPVHLGDCIQAFGLFKPDTVTPYGPDELPLARAIHGESVSGAEVFVRNSTQPQGLWMAVNARPLTDGEGRIAGGVAVMRDVTDAKAASGRYEDVTLELERCRRDLALLARLARRSLAETLSPAVSQADPAHAAVCSDLARRLGDGVQADLESAVALAEISVSEPCFEPVDLGLVAQQTSHELNEAVVAAGGSVFVGPLPYVQADPIQIRVMLRNLLLLGLHSRRPGVPPRIVVHGAVEPAPPDLRVTPSPGEVSEVCRLTVVDNGIGFGPEFQDSIFELSRWFAAKPGLEACGRDLALSVRIVEKHFGALKALGAPGQGATYLVTLPVRRLR